MSALHAPNRTRNRFVELLAIPCDVALGGDGGMLSGLDGILLGGQAERIVTHRMQDVEPFQPLVTGENVGSDITQRMTDMQTGTGRIREHVEHVKFGTSSILGDAIGMIFAPKSLPFGLYLLEIVIHIGMFFRQN